MIKFFKKGNNIPKADDISLINYLEKFRFNKTLRFSNLTINSNSKIEYKLDTFSHIAWSDILNTSSTLSIETENDKNQVMFKYNGTTVSPRYLPVIWGNGPHTLKIDNNKFYIDNILKATASSSSMNTATWLEINTNSRQLQTDFYELKLYSSNVLVHHFVPAEVQVYGESSVTKCIWDKIDKKVAMII